MFTFMITTCTWCSRKKYNGQIWQITRQKLQTSRKVSNQPLDSLEISNLLIFEEKYYYWRQFIKEGNDFYFPTVSCLYFEALEDFSELYQKARLARKETFALFQDQNYLFAHLPQIYNDRVGQQIAAFVDYSKIKIFPLLHINRIKVKNSSKSLTD